MGILLGIFARRRWLFMSGFILIVVGLFTPKPTGTIVSVLGFALMVAQIPVAIWQERKKRREAIRES